VLSVLDRAGIFVFALSGALLTVRVRFDIVGVVVLAIHIRWQAPRASDLRDWPSQESGLERRRHAG